MKKVIGFLGVAFLMLLLISCFVTEDEQQEVTIVATLFPQYDFARAIVGDTAEVKLVLPPGVDTHSFEPSPMDVVEIYNADLFIYTGEAMEPWAQKIADAVVNENLLVINATEGIEFCEEEDHGDHGGHQHEADPHVWLDFENAGVMVDNIKDALIEKFPAHEQLYTLNADNYKKQLNQLDQDFRQVLTNDVTLVFGGKFAYHYFLERYGVNYRTVFDSCGAETDPGVRKISQVIEFIKENDIKCIFYEELADPVTARSIANQTGIQYEMFSTGHNVTKEEFDNGVTFLDVMRQNLANIRNTLN